MSYRAGISPPRKGIPLLTEPEGERLAHKTKPPCHQPLALMGLPTETKEGLPGILQGVVISPLAIFSQASRLVISPFITPFGSEQSAALPSLSPYSPVLF